MLLSLGRIRAAQERYESVFGPEAFTNGHDGFQVIGPVSLAFDIFKDKEQFHLVGAVQATLDLPCSRCLEPFSLPVDAAFDLRYQPHALNSGEGEREIEDDDLTTAFYENETIDLGQLMREQFHLALPMKPLCEEDCLGLCAACGANLNQGACGCKREWEDPRLAVLKALRDDHHN
jgi:uncharacterized protein